MPEQNVLDLGRFDPKTTDLDLVVRAALEENKTIPAPGDEIASRVQPTAMGFRERACGHLGLLEVATRETDAFEKEFAGRAEGDFSASGTENVHGGITDGCPDGGITVLEDAVVTERHDARFGRAVQVEYVVLARIPLNEVDGQWFTYGAEGP